MRFDTRVFLVIDGADAQIALELFEGLLDLGQLDVVLPQASGMFCGEIRAEQVAPFSAPNDAEFVPVLNGRGHR